MVVAMFLVELFVILGCPLGDLAPNPLPPPLVPDVFDITQDAAHSRCLVPHSLLHNPDAFKRSELATDARFEDGKVYVQIDVITN